MDFPDIDADYALSLAVNAVNDTVGPKGIVPSLLVFGIYPRFRLSSAHPGLKNQRERMNAL